MTTTTERELMGGVARDHALRVMVEERTAQLDRDVAWYLSQPEPHRYADLAHEAAVELAALRRIVARVDGLIGWTEGELREAWGK